MPVFTIYNVFYNVFFMKYRDFEVIPIDKDLISVYNLPHGRYF